MMDIVFPVHNRREFTEVAARELAKNTDPKLVDRVLVYDDMSEDRAGEVAVALLAPAFPYRVQLCRGPFGSPVAIMNDYLTFASDKGPGLFAKIDNDTVVPPAWANVCQILMDSAPDLDLLGIEPHCPINPADPAEYGRNPIPRTYMPAPFIGGIGVMRVAAFHGPHVKRMVPQKFFGFTAWQDQHPNVIKGWLKPALPVVLLDRIPNPPWSALSDKYVAAGWQRPWPPYNITQGYLWRGLTL